MAVDDWVSEIGFSEDALRTPRTAASDLEGGDNLAEDLERIYRVGKRVLNASRKLVAGRLDEQRQGECRRIPNLSFFSRSLSFSAYSVSL